MLKFFRHIRQNLLFKGNLRKYLVYAVGEVFLVMIGILLALQINNWNDARKNRQSFELLFDNIEADLISNIEESNIGINFYTEKDSLLQLVLNEKVTEEMYERIPVFRNLILNGWNYDLLMDNIQILIEREEQAPAKYKEVFPLVKSYKNWVANHQRNEAAVIDNVDDNHIYFSENFHWFLRNDSLSIQQSIQYFTIDSLYWNRVGRYAGLQRRLGSRVNRCRNEALVLLAKIHLIRNKIPLAKLSSFFQQFGLVPLEQLDCEEAIAWRESFSYLKLGYFIFNSTQSPVQLIVHEENKAPKSITIPPYVNWQIRSLHEINSNHILELGTQECEMQYRPAKNGFLLIK